MGMGRAEGKGLLWALTRIWSLSWPGLHGAALEVRMPSLSFHLCMGRAASGIFYAQLPQTLPSPTESITSWALCSFPGM